jgi:hypothetical protein
MPTGIALCYFMRHIITFVIRKHSVHLGALTELQRTSG